MGNTYKPKTKHRCEKCGWTGKRFFTKVCPQCGFWHPKKVEDPWRIMEFDRKHLVCGCGSTRFYTRGCGEDRIKCANCGIVCVMYHAWLDNLPEKKGLEKNA